MGTWSADVKVAAGYIDPVLFISSSNGSKCLTLCTPIVNFF